LIFSENGFAVGQDEQQFFTLARLLSHKQFVAVAIVEVFFKLCSSFL